MQQAIFPFLGDGAFLRQQRTSAELEHDGAKFGVIDPVVPVLERPDTPGHDDGHIIRNAAFAHRVAQCLDAGIGILRRTWILGIGKAIMAAGQPRIFIDHRRQPFRRLGIGTLPQSAEGATRRHDGQIGHVIGCRDFGKLVRHARAAGDACHHAARLFQYAMQHALRAAHFP